jgi:hypothetical protein
MVAKRSMGERLMKKSEVIAKLAEDIARNGDGECFIAWNKGKIG